MNHDFYFGEKAAAQAHPSLINDTTRRLWRSFSFCRSELLFSDTDDFVFLIGTPPLPALECEKEYALRVTERGAAVVGRDEGGLMRGFMRLLMMIVCEGGNLRIPATEEQSDYAVKNRMLHLCVFPENDLYFIKKLIRLAGMCQYTHVVLEFWGTLKYDCMKELAWPNARSKEEARELIREIRSFGMEPVPMFNHLGHASASRVRSGKHVVLDQNPALFDYFTPDGWAWDVTSEKAAMLLKQIRAELYALFGPGEYLHIGCDEAYFYTRCAERRPYMAKFLHRLTYEIANENRRAMLWMDMLLEKDKYPNCYSVCAPEDVELMQQSLHPSAVMVDWQYDVFDAPIPSLAALKDSGHDVIGAPWFNPKNYAAHVKTVADCGLFGIMLTTWHTLASELPSILGCAKCCGAKTFAWSDYSGLREESATLLRKLSFEGNSYADCGWMKEQIALGSVVSVI